MTQTTKNALWNAVGNTAYNGLQWLITVIVTRSSLYSSGLLAAAMSVSLTFRSIAYFGVHDFLVSDARNKYTFSDYWGLRLITGITAFFLCLIFSFISSYDADSIYAVMLYMLFRLSESFSDLFYSIMQKNDRLDMAGIFMTVKAVVTAILFFFGFFSGGLTAALLLMSVSALVLTFTAEQQYICKFTHGITISFLSIKPLISEVLPIFICQIETAVIFNLPQYIISVFFDKAVLGAYASVFSLSLVIQAAFQYVYTPFVVRFAELSAQKDTVQFRKLILKMIRLLLFITIIFCLFAAIFGETIITCLFGSKMLNYSYMILPLVLSVCCYSAMSFVRVVKISARNIKAVMISHSLGLFISVPLTIAFIRVFGVNGASYGFAAAASITAITMCRVREK